MAATNVEGTDDWDIGNLKEKLAEGKIPHSIFKNKEFFEIEKKEIFEKEWIVLGHESEISDPGDYVVRNICDHNLIVCRDEDSDIRVFFNKCKHQGMEVCQTEMGNTSHFRCPYHGWTFDNAGELTGVPFKDIEYPDTDLSDVALDEPQYDTYNGVIFACLDPSVEPLNEYLGEFKFYFDLFFGRSEEGMEVFGPQRRIINANWKVGSMNTMSDHHHSVTTHRSCVEIELGPAGGVGAKMADPRYFVQAGPSGLMIKKHGYYREHPLRDIIEEAFSDELWEFVSGDYPMNGGGTLLPNTNILTSYVRIEEGDEGIPITYMRTYRPISPDETEVLTWCVVESDAPKELKEKTKKAYTMSFGISGMLEQDDLGNWSSVTNMASDNVNEEDTLRIDMLLNDEPVEWDYPGEAYESPFHEANMRYFYENIYGMMDGDDK